MFYLIFFLIFLFFFSFQIKKFNFYSAESTTGGIKRKLNKSCNSVFSLYYHLILVENHNRRALSNIEIRDRLKQIIYKLVQHWKTEKNKKMMIEIIYQESGEYYHHIVFRAIPETNLISIINSMKTVTSRYLRKEFPNIKKYYLPKSQADDTIKSKKDNSFWAPKYVLATTGQVSLENLIGYIENVRNLQEKN